VSDFLLLSCALKVAQLAMTTPPAVKSSISVYFSHAHESRFYRRCLRMSLLRMQKNTNRVVDAEQNTSPHFEGDDAFVAEKLQSVRTGALPALILIFSVRKSNRFI